MEEKTCCVTGHRNIPAEQAARVRAALCLEIDSAIEDGYTRFISGMAEGVDLCFAAIVAKRRETNPALRLEAAIPYRRRLQNLTRNPVTKLTLDACTDISVISEDYAPEVFLKRNRYMVSRSSRVIAVYDGRGTGGTAYTIRFAQMCKTEVRDIRLGRSKSN